MASNNTPSKRTQSRHAPFERIQAAARTVARAWRHGNARQRTALATIGLLASIVALALVISLVRFVSWRAEAHQARAEQQQLVEQFDFNPGNIISNTQFFNGSAMNQKEIQAFLDEKGAECTERGCLRNATFSTEPRAASDYCTEYKGSSKQKASAIIADAATACNVSPKVLLTMLQKEQQLVTATKTPSEFRFKAAMGLSCPDDDSCDPRYAGFFRQVFGSAERYQYYVRHEDQYGFHAGTLNYVQFNPDAACGGSEVYIENTATALLYIYTPYQPNLAALEAGAGEGDACSTYGNRNFSIIYSGWFGDPRA